MRSLRRSEFLEAISCILEVFESNYATLQTAVVLVTKQYPAVGNYVIITIMVVQ